MLPLVWRRTLRAVRLGLGLACLGLQFSASAPAGIGLLFTSAFAGFSLYAACVFLWGKQEESGWALTIDALMLFLILSTRTPYFEFLGIAFYTFVLSEAILQHEWWWPVVIAALCIVDLNFTQPPSYPVLFPALAGAGVLSSIVAIERFYMRDRLAHASRQSVLYRYESEKARESERQRIAADFHDGPLQSFTSFQMRLEAIRTLMERGDPSASGELEQLQDFCRSQVQELRAFVRGMRPVDIDGSLGASLRRIIEQFQKDSGIPASFVNTGFTDPAESDISVELLQIVREALYNVQKHSGATRVAVSVNKVDGVLEISIEDNGKGFPFSGRYTLEELELLRLGPGSIKSRVKTLGAELLLDSKPSQGACVKIRLAA